jgi:hypothetical protein
MITINNAYSCLFQQFIGNGSGLIECIHNNTPIRDQHILI